jgi:hypothetical protein
MPGCFPRFERDGILADFAGLRALVSCQYARYEAGLTTLKKAAQRQIRSLLFKTRGDGLFTIRSDIPVFLASPIVVPNHPNGWATCSATRASQ